MKRLAVATVCALFALVSRAGAAPIVLNFDGFPDDTVLAIGHFDGIGIHFDQRLQVNDGDVGDLPFSLPNTAVNFDSFGGSITGTFLGPLAGGVTSISVFAGDAGGDVDTVTLNGYNAANVLVDTATFTGIAAQLLSISGLGIVRFEILQIGLIAIDDFTVDGAAVPEPASLVLLGAGLLGLAARNRLRQRTR